MFFFSIGLTTDITLLADIVWLLLAAILVTMIGKLASGTLSGQVYQLGRLRSLRVGFGIVPHGGSSLVIATLAASVRMGALEPEIPAFTAGYVLLMSILVTVLIQNADGLLDRVGQGSREEPAD